MTLFIMFIGIIIIVSIVSNVGKNHNKTNEHTHYMHSTNDFTNDSQISSQDNNHCADYSSTTSDSSCGSSGE